MDQVLAITIIVGVIYAFALALWPKAQAAHNGQDET